MSKKSWIATQLVNRASEEDLETAQRMLGVAKHLDKCGSATIWDVANRGYRSRLKDNPDAKVPNVEECVEVTGDGDSVDHSLSVSGIACCKRVQCPLCCYTRSIMRRTWALEWAKSYDWGGYYGVLVTFTVPHKLTDSENAKSFSKVLSRLMKSATRFSRWYNNISTCGRRGVSKDIESLGCITSLEFTFGKNGLHPHFHTVFLTKCEEDIDKLEEFFKKERTKIWTEAGLPLCELPEYKVESEKKIESKKLKRMPKENERRSFERFLKPGDENFVDKVVFYVSKGLMETLSSPTKDQQKAKTSKSIFDLTGHELKYFCTFFESTKGKRFYRAGGICKSITKEKRTGIVLKKPEDEIKSIVRLSTKDEATPDGWVSEFVTKYTHDFQKVMPQLTADAIQRMVILRWRKFKKWKQLGSEFGARYGETGT
jgi:hypothetical protein